MTTARHAAPSAGQGRLRRAERRRRVREQLLAGLFLLVVVLVTILLLALQWLHGGSSSVTLPQLTPNYGGLT